MQNKQMRNWIVGATLSGGFVLALWLDLTGVRVHQWLGVALAALATYRLAVHWRWVVAVTGRLFGHTSRQARAFYMVDAALALGFVAILASGLVISNPGHCSRYTDSNGNGRCDYGECAS
jgi:cytochrome b561